MSDLDGFLKKVDEVEALVKGIKVDEPGAIEKADSFIATQNAGDKATGFNRTVINKDSSSDVFQGIAPGTDQAGFMRAVEADAQERTYRRELAQKAAAELKEKGNEAIKSNNYAEAVKHYSEAIRYHPDNSLLYSNRSQAYIRMSEFDKAREDSEKALHLDSGNLKAYMRLGIALRALCDFEGAIKTFETGRKRCLGENQEPFLREVKETMFAQTEFKEQKSAKEALEAGNADAVKMKALTDQLTDRTATLPVIARVCTEMQPLLKTPFGQTILRMHNGLQILVSNAAVEKAALSDAHGAGEHDALCAILAVLCDGCIEAQASQRDFLRDTARTAAVLKALLKSSNPSVCRSTLQLLVHLSVSPVPRQALVTEMFEESLQAGLRPRYSSCTLLGLRYICLLSAEMPVRQRARTTFYDFFYPPIAAHLQSFCLAEPDASHTTAVLTLLLNLTIDAGTRQTIAAKSTCLDACLRLLEKLMEPKVFPEAASQLSSLFGFLSNLALVETALKTLTTGSTAVKSALHCLQHQDKQVVERAIGLLARLASQPTVIAQIAEEQESSRLRQMLGEKPNQTLLENLSRLLAKCASLNQNVCQAYALDKTFLPQLCALLPTASDAAAGNLALCLAKCLDAIPAKLLTLEVNVVDMLLDHIKKENSSAQENCSIALARLAKAHAKYMNRMRDLNGIEILQARFKASSA
eukprot:m.212797 g.212797  ORF g.212797 m.212797 type:complete len:697 (-) comp21608_c0_seq1:451-2541(-)